MGMILTVAMAVVFSGFLVVVLWVLWVVVVVDFMSFVLSGRVGFFHGVGGGFSVAEVLVMGFFMVVVVSFLWLMWW